MSESKFQEADQYRKNKQYPQATALLAELWEVHPSDRVGWRYAECLRKSGQLEKAEEIARQALARFPQDAFTRKQLGWVLKDQQRFTEASEVFEELPNVETDRFVVGDYITCLRKAGRLDDAEKVARAGLAYDQTNHSSADGLGWVIYDKKLKPAKEDSNLDAIIDAANEIMALEPNEMLTGKTIMAVMKVAKEQNTTKWQVVLDWSNKVKPENLSSEAREISGRHIMSERETYYIGRTKALYETKQYQEARAQAEKGMSDFPCSFFLARLEALAQAQTGDIDGAVQKMQALQQHRQCAWYARAELAEMEYRLGRTEEAYRLMCVALSSTQQSAEFLPTHLVTLSKIALDLGKLDVAATHIRLAHVARTNQNWSIPAELIQLEALIQNKFDEQGSSPTLPENERELLRKCQSYWRENSVGGAARKQGILVSPRDPNAQYRFIKPKDGGDQIFVHKRHLPRDFDDGMAVEFSIQSSFDKKKNRDSVEAVDVRPIR